MQQPDKEFQSKSRLTRNISSRSIFTDELSWYKYVDPNVPRLKGIDVDETVMTLYNSELVCKHTEEISITKKAYVAFILNQIENDRRDKGTFHVLQKQVVTKKMYSLILPTVGNFHVSSSTCNSIATALNNIFKEFKSNSETERFDYIFLLRDASTDEKYDMINFEKNENKDRPANVTIGPVTLDIEEEKWVDHVVYPVGSYSLDFTSKAVLALVMYDLIVNSRINIRHVGFSHVETAKVLYYLIVPTPDGKLVDCNTHVNMVRILNYSLTEYMRKNKVQYSGMKESTDCIFLEEMPTELLVEHVRAKKRPYPIKLFDPMATVEGRDPAAISIPVGNVIFSETPVSVRNNLTECSREPEEKPKGGKVDIDFVRREKDFDTNWMVYFGLAPLVSHLPNPLQIVANNVLRKVCLRSNDTGPFCKQVGIQYGMNVFTCTLYGVAGDALEYGYAVDLNESINACITKYFKGMFRFSTFVVSDNIAALYQARTLEESMEQCMYMFLDGEAEPLPKLPKIRGHGDIPGLIPCDEFGKPYAGRMFTQSQYGGTPESIEWAKLTGKEIIVERSLTGDQPDFVTKWITSTPHRPDQVLDPLLVEWKEASTSGETKSKFDFNIYPTFSMAREVDIPYKPFVPLTPEDLITAAKTTNDYQQRETRIKKLPKYTAFPENSDAKLVLWVDPDKNFSVAWLSDLEPCYRVLFDVLQDQHLGKEIDEEELSILNASLEPANLSHWMSQVFGTKVDFPKLPGENDSDYLSRRKSIVAHIGIWLIIQFRSVADSEDHKFTMCSYKEIRGVRLNGEDSTTFLTRCQKLLEGQGDESVDDLKDWVPKYQPSNKVASKLIGQNIDQGIKAIGPNHIWNSNLQDK